MIDLIVVGLGAMGSAVTYQAQKRGLSVLGIDRHDPPHDLGSTHAETRITRLAVGEGSQYLPLVARSHELWREIEVLSGDTLLHTTGGLIISEPAPARRRWHDFAKASANTAEAAGIDFALLDPSDVMQRHPMLNLSAEANVGFEPTGGLVMAEKAVAAQLGLAEAAGAVLRTNETVVEIDPGTDDVLVRTTEAAYRASKVVLATGPWIGELADPVQSSPLTVTRQVVYWFEAEDLEVFSVDRLPFVMWIGATEEDYFGLFPRPPGGTNGVKMMTEQFLDTTTAEAVERQVGQDEIDDFYHRYVEPKIDGIKPTCLRATVCLYTNTPDDHFLIADDPRSDRIVVLSPCSGHGFKHSAAIGEAIAEQVETGTSTLDLSPFQRIGST